MNENPSAPKPAETGQTIREIMQQYENDGLSPHAALRAIAETLDDSEFCPNGDHACNLRRKCVNTQCAKFSAPKPASAGWQGDIEQLKMALRALIPICRTGPLNQICTACRANDFEMTPHAPGCAVEEARKVLARAEARTQSESPSAAEIHNRFCGENGELCQACKLAGTGEGGNVKR